MSLTDFARLRINIFRTAGRHVLRTVFLLLLFHAVQTALYAQCGNVPPTGAPAGFSATPGKAKVTLTWGAVNCAVSYDVYRSDDGGAFYNSGSTSNTTRVVTSSIANGHTYSFYVRAKNNYGYGPASNTASAEVKLGPASPSARAEKAQIRVTWGAVQDADSYRLSRSSDGVNWSSPSVVSGTSYLQTNVSNGNTYYYKVRAYNAGGLGEEGSPASAYIDLPAPSGLGLTHNPDGSITVSWGGVQDADTYRLYKSPDGLNNAFTDNLTATSYTVTNPHGPPSYYWVQAKNSAGFSPISNKISTDDFADSCSTSCQSCPAGPLDHAGSGSESGGSSGDPVNLATGRESYSPSPDLTVYNPSGPGVTWQRHYYAARALKGYGSPGFSSGWVHAYDVFLHSSAGAWGNLYLNFNHGGSQTLVPAIDGSGQPTGVITTPTSSSYFVSGVPGASAGEWQSVSVTWKDQTVWRFTAVSVGVYALTRVTSRTGQSIDLSWTPARALTQIGDASSGAIILTLAYDGDGRLASVTDSFNRQIVYAYEAPFGSDPGRLKSVSQVVTAGTADPPARWSFTYDRYNGQQLKSISVPSPTGSGNSTATINYDARGRVTSLVDANGNQRAYTYNAGNTLVQVKDAANNVAISWTQKFTAGKHDAGTTDANNKSTVVEYGDAQNPSKPTSIKDKNDKVTTYTYDQHGNVLTVTTPRNVTTTYTYNYAAFPLGRLTSVQEGTKPATTFAYYEPSGLLQSVTSPSPAGTGTVTNTFTYDSLGNVLTAAGPGNNAAAQITTTYNYTSDGAYTQAAKLGQPLTVTDNLGHATHLRYDAQGRVTSSTDALGHETNVSYNLAGQVESVTLPATNQTGAGRGRTAHTYLYTGGPILATTVYDESGAQVRQVTRAYGPEGEPLSVTGSTEPVSSTYDALYRLKTLKDGNNNATTYGYNSVGHLASVQMPGGETVQFPSYDPAGNLLQRIDGNNVTTNYLYDDAEGRLTDIQYPATPALNAHFGYDSYGRRTSMTDGSGCHAYAYNNLDILTSQTTAYTGLPARTISYAYYPDGSRQSMNTPAGTFSYGYDAAGRPASLTNPFAETSGWTYLDNNWLRTQQLGNGAATTYTYNPLGQMVNLVNRTSGGATLSQFGSMTHDGSGNRTSFTASVPGLPSLSGTTTYQYDSRDQLTQEQTTRGGGFTHAFGYDGAGNPTNFRGAAKTYNANNQQTAAGLTHDGNGDPNSRNGVSLTFDPESRLTGYGGTLVAGYRGDHLRAWKESAGVRTYFLYDGDVTIIELDSVGSVTATNTFGARGLVSRRAGADSAFYTFDPQGGVAQKLDANQAVVSSHLYDAHGAALGAPASDPFGYGGQWGYQTDAATGMQLLTYRYYDPSAGRFLTRDPIKYSGGVNLYAYVLNSPINLTDPSGLCAGCCTGCKKPLPTSKYRPKEKVIKDLYTGNTVRRLCPERDLKPLTPNWEKLRDCLIQADDEWADFLKKGWPQESLLPTGDDISQEGVNAGLGAIIGGTVANVPGAAAGAIIGLVAVPVNKAIKNVATSAGSAVGYAGAIGDRKKTCWKKYVGT